MNKMTKREAIESVATDLRESAAKRGISMTQKQARDMVASARERGDRLRENNR